MENTFWDINRDGNFVELFKKAFCYVEFLSDPSLMFSDITFPFHSASIELTPFKIV